MAKPDFGMWERTVGDRTVRREADSAADAVFLKFEGWKQIPRGVLPDPDEVEAAARAGQPAAPADQTSKK